MMSSAFKLHHFVSRVTIKLPQNMLNSTMTTDNTYLKDYSLFLPTTIAPRVIENPTSPT